ncbi:MAG TPA: hypothetical protein VM325_20365 [Alphaproteobacteria bacterium]|nr:hypothetical protein [Alphaproteobacteria bacterium]
MKLKTLAVLAIAAAALPVAASAETPASRKDQRVTRIFDRLDLNKDGKITRAELKQYREAQFKAADADGNGAINSIEMAAFVKARMSERVNARFAALDTDKNGKITLDEMRNRKASRGGRAGRMSGRMGRHTGGRKAGRMGQRGRLGFWRMDRDGDGAVSKEELTRVAQRRGHRRIAFRFARLDDNRNGLISKEEYVEAPTRLFRRFDADGDGVVTREEVQTAMANFRRHRGERRRRGRGGDHHRGYRGRDGWGGSGRHEGGRGHHGMRPGGGWPQDN